MHHELTIVKGLICQYKSKEYGLASRPPTLFTAVSKPMHDTSCHGLNSSLHA